MQKMLTRTEYLNICYRDENLADVYKELFDESVERYNVGKEMIEDYELL